MMIKAEHYNGSAKNYIRKFILSQLPKVDTVINYSKSLEDHLSNPRNLRIVRKFGKHNLRCNKYIYDNQIFTVSDNEAALWVYMEALEGAPMFNYEYAITNQIFPIAFALTTNEQENELAYTNTGKKARENRFSTLGWKHCHLFDCSPRTESINDLSIDQRMRRLLNPMNHFPFPSPRKFKISKDYGEDSQFRLLVIELLRTEFYKTKEQKEEFLDFVLKAGISADSIYKTTDDFKISVGSCNIASNILTGGTMNRINERNFILKQKYQGKGLIIEVYDATKGQHFEYDHDNLLDSVFEERFGENGSAKKSWDKYRYYTKTNGYPKWATEFIKEC